MSKDLLLAIDVGQTSTKAVLARSDGWIIGWGRGGPADHFHVRGGFERNRAALHDAIHSAYGDARLAPDEVAAAALGVTGIHAESPDIQLVEEIVREVVTARVIGVHPDYVMNLAGASRGSWGIAIIAGGGSVAYGISRNREKEGIAGGFGYLLDDEGSAFDIGRRAVKAAIWAADRRGPATILARLVRAHFSLDTMYEIKRIVYHADFSRDRISHLAPLVMRAAADKDGVAQAIVHEAAEALARLGSAVASQIAEPGEEIPVYPTGGVFEAGDTILAPFATYLQRGWPGSDIRLPALPPVIGSLIEAQRAAGGETGDVWLTTVQRSFTRPPAARVPEVRSRTGDSTGS